MTIQFGIEQLVEQPPGVLSGARLGLLFNQASVNLSLHLSCDLLAERFPGQVTALFSPQHGIWGEQQANMIETGNGVYTPLGLPIYSLYSETRCPKEETLNEIDCLVIDLQDVGTRVYTFIWTMLECLRACAQYGKSVLICDRPNPIGGTVFEGPMLRPEFKSFVGGSDIPLRHGLTICELARLFVSELQLDVDLHCVQMCGWRRPMTWQATDRQWVWPSPNMPTPTTAWLYPGQVLLEGTNLSEGRGTTRPFEVVGAPFLNSGEWLHALAKFEHPGLCLRPTRFVPVFDKWQSTSCGGIDLYLERPEAVRSVATTVAIILTASQLAPSDVAWLDPPYEYEYDQLPINILFGSDALTKLAAKRSSTNSFSQQDVAELLAWDEASWLERIEPILLYAM